MLLLVIPLFKLEPLIFKILDGRLLPRSGLARGWIARLNWSKLSSDRYPSECIVPACRGMTRPERHAVGHLFFSLAEEHRHNQRNVGLDPGGGTSSLCPQSVRTL